MHQSSLMKFQGALVGMYVADPAQSHPGQSGNTFKDYALLTSASIESILHCRDVNVEDWLVSVNRLMRDDQLPIAVLPIALYLHDDLPRLQSTIQEIADRYQLNPENIASLSFFALAIAKLAAGNCSPRALIPQILSDKSFLAGDVANQLQLVQDQIFVNNVLPNIPQFMGEVVACGQPHLWPIAMASYCFLSNPEYFRLAVDRSAHLPGQPFLTMAFTGALLGAANGVTNIQPQLYLSGGQTAEQLSQLGKKLWTIWTGVYQAGIFANSPVVAAPAPLLQGK